MLLAKMILQKLHFCKTVNFDFCRNVTMHRKLHFTSTVKSNWSCSSQFSE